jgi:anaerobic ribonucleoside-triphosphate reductase
MVQALVGNRTITVTDEERQVCEVWTRVMGYYRPVSEFNIGKKSEHAERAFFNEGKVTELL